MALTIQASAIVAIAVKTAAVMTIAPNALAAAAVSRIATLASTPKNACVLGLGIAWQSRPTSNQLDVFIRQDDDTSLLELKHIERP